MIHQNNKDDVAVAYNAMLRLLARREYSCFELKQKLRSKFSSQAIEKALQSCIDKNYQSDERFANMLLSHCLNCFYGPLKYRSDACKKGLDQNLVNNTIANVDWYLVAFNALLKKYKDLQFENYEQKQKALSFLARRGFFKDHCIKALQEFCARFNEN